MDPTSASEKSIWMSKGANYSKLENQDQLSSPGAEDQASSCGRASDCEQGLLVYS